MPIRSLTVTQSSVHEGLSCIGKIRKGAPKEVKRGANGKEYTTLGKDLEWFRFTAEPEFAGVERVFAEIYGNEPTFFDPVYIIGDTVEDAFNPWMEEWKATALLHRCDEETQVLSYNAQAEMYIKARIPCEKLCPGHTCGCKPVGRLSLLMPELMNALGVSGYISVETHSVNDILSLQHALNAAVAMTGRITGVAFIFGRAPEKISARIVQNGQAKRVNTTKSLFFLRPNEDYTRNNLLPELAASGDRPMFGNGQVVVPQLPRPEGDPRLRLANDPTKPRRIGGPVTVASAPVEADDSIPTVTGELVDDTPDATQSGVALVGPKWSAPDQRKWVAKQQANGHSDRFLLTALGIDSYEAFEGSVAEADAKLDTHIAAQQQQKEAV